MPFTSAAPAKTITPVCRIVLAAGLLLAASLPGLHCPKVTRSTVTSSLMAEEGARGGNMPIANNFARNAIVIRHWSKAVVTVHVATTVDASAEEIDEANRAIALWDDHFKTVSLRRVNDAESADIDVNFVAPAQLTGGAVGKTDALYNPENNELVHAAIHLSQKLSNDRLEQAICHEMGHALGIQGHSDNKSDLMYPYSHLPVAITDRDVNTLATGYNGK